MFALGTIHAQQSWGIKGGWSVSNLSTNDGEIDDSKARHGFTLGVFGNYPVLGIFSFQPELLYTQKGGLVKSGNSSVETKSGYIEVPLGLQLNIFKRLYFYLGPQFSFLTNIEVNYEAGNISISIDKDESNYRRMDAGIFGGLGLQNEKYFLDARITRGMVDYDKESLLSAFQEDYKNLTNFSFALTTGIRF